MHRRPPYPSHAAVFVTLSSFTTTLLVKMRLQQRLRDGLPHTGATNQADCCVAFWPCTGPCAAAQMLRQEGLGRANYELCSTDGGEATIKMMAVVPV